LGRRRWLPLFALGIVYVVWGSTYLAIRVVVHDLPPFAAAFARFFSAGLVMAAIAAWNDRKRGWPSWRQVFHYGVVGILLLAAANGMVMWAEQTVPSGIAALLIATIPLWLTLLDGLRPGGQPWTRRVWAGTLLGFVGVAFVARPEGAVASGDWLGILVIVAASFTWSVGSLYAQSIRQRLPLFTVAAIEMLAASPVLVLVSWLFGEDLGRFKAAPPAAWLGLVYLVVFGSLVAFTAFAYCLSELPASTVGTYAYVNPIVAVFLGHAILDEALSAGAVLILLGVLLTTRHPAGPASRPRDARRGSATSEEGAA
jgi:drug/metabolite transporter (DMT)-like permease